ncbi:MAG: C13 family peptidase [Candidatus Hermodarchaeota archaeon]
MNRKKLIPIISAGIIIIIVIALIVIFIPFGGKRAVGARKAIILSSANDYYRKEGEPDFNNGEDGKFDGEPFPSKWIEDYKNNSYGGIDSSIPGHNTPGVIQLIVTAPATLKYVNTEFVYNWTKYYPLIKYAAYNLSAWVNITTNINTPPIFPAIIVPFTGAGARIGLRWINSSNDIVRTDWSEGIFGPFIGWTFLNVTGIADNSTLNDITQLHLVLAVEGNMTGTTMVLFDDIKVEYWFPPPIPSPPPSNVDSDGFPAQALQVYWVLKNHGYTDDNIFLMLYHTNDNIIDINANDGIPNDLVGAVVDVENDDVNASRFKYELDISSSGSFASNIKPNDQLIIFMTDHGSNKVLGGGNATFHFEADDSYISEMEFYNLVKLINCKRILINIDSCFSGNFLNQDSNIGLSWYNIPNSILVTASSDNLAWSWRNVYNGDGFAGSWFFHHFWNQLNQSQTIGSAFDFAKNYIPVGYVNSVFEIQNPLIQDNLGIKDTWSFTNTPSL